MKDEELHPLDVRRRSKEESCRILFQAEMTYLMSRGWQPLCGVSDKYMVAPGDDYRAEDCPTYSHEEALAMQKANDK